MTSNIKLLPKQWEVFSVEKGVDYDVKLYQGGVGSGKTFLGSLTGLSVLANNHGATWLVGADSWARLKITTWETMQEQLDGASIRFSANKSDHIITIPDWGDARVIFKGMDDPYALRSVNGIGGHLEEASLLEEAAYLEFLGRLRQGKSADPIRVILTTNPQARRGWLYDRFVTNGGLKTQEVRGNKVTISQKRVIAPTLDNPHVSDAFISMLQSSYDDETYKVMVLGEDGDFRGGLVCSSWSEANIDDTIRYDDALRLYLTCDFNVDPMCWEIAHRVCGVSGDTEYRFLDELAIENTNIVKCAEEFARRYYNHKAAIIVTGDATGRNRSDASANPNDTKYRILVQTLSELGMRNVHLDVPRSNPHEDVRVMAWNGLVCNVDGIRRIKVHPRCKWLIWNMNNMQYVEGSTVIEEPSPRKIEADTTRTLKFTKHPFDAASYLTYHYDKPDVSPARNRPQFRSRY